MYVCICHMFTLASFQGCCTCVSIHGQHWLLNVLPGHGNSSTMSRYHMLICPCRFYLKMFILPVDGNMLFVYVWMIIVIACVQIKLNMCVKLRQRESGRKANKSIISKALLSPFLCSVCGISFTYMINKYIVRL